MTNKLTGKISPHFLWRELLHSDTAQRKGISNSPSLMAASNLTRVAYFGVEPARIHFGKWAKVTSGYRSPALNRAIGGSMTSNHSIGCAIDFEIPGIDNYTVCKWMSENLKNFDEIILEGYTAGDPNSGWIHVAVRPEANRKKVLTWNRGQGYRKGLIR